MNDNYHTHNISIVFISKSCFIPIQPHENKDPRIARIFTRFSPFSTQPRNRWSLPTCWLNIWRLSTYPLNPPSLRKNPWEIRVEHFSLKKGKQWVFSKGVIIRPASSGWGENGRLGGGIGWLISHKGFVGISDFAVPLWLHHGKWKSWTNDTWSNTESVLVSTLLPPKDVGLETSINRYFLSQTYLILRAASLPFFSWTKPLFFHTLWSFKKRGV